MANAIIFDIEATDKDKPILVEAAWVTLDSISPVSLGEEFHQRYNPGKPISLGQPTCLQ
jgi:exodeoxyribonuclease X